MVDPLIFRMIPDTHFGDCVVDFDIGPQMANIDPEDFRNVFLNNHDNFLDMIEEGSEERDRIKEYANYGPPDTPYTGGDCEICGEAWHSDEGYEIVADGTRIDVYEWFDANRPDLMAMGLVSPTHGPDRCECCRWVIPLDTQTVINRHDA